MAKIVAGVSVSTKKVKIFSDLIRFVYKTDYSHCYIRVPRKSGIDVIYQASGSQINFVGHELFAKEHKVIKEWVFDIDDVSISRFYDFAVSKAGYPYSILQALGMGLAQVFHLNKNPLTGVEPAVCSTLAVSALGSVKNVPVFTEEKLSIFSPKDFYKMCEELSSGDTAK